MNVAEGEREDDLLVVGCMTWIDHDLLRCAWGAQDVGGDVHVGTRCVNSWSIIGARRAEEC